MSRIFIFLIIFFKSDLVFNQSIPINNFIYRSRLMVYDAGEDWESLTLFGSAGYSPESNLQVTKLSSDTFFRGFIDFQFGSRNHSLQGFGYLKFKDHFYGYIYPTLLNKTPKKNHSNYTNTNFFNEKDGQSGLGFKNDWAILQIGRGRESWGAGTNIQLALSDYSSMYDYFVLGSDYGQIRVRYIHGFLENIENNINRFITARGFEWTNKKSLIVGLSETVIYSGKNRSIDIGYFNPMSSHLEIELNERLNFTGNGNSNAVWQFHIEYLLKNNIRFSLNYLIDEFVIDKQIEIEKEHGNGLSMRLAYTPLQSSNNILTFYSSFVYVGTPTFRHKYGSNNFVQNGRPLGWPKGSDGLDYSIGVNFSSRKNIILSIFSGFFQSGEESTTQRVFDPYEDYQPGIFPSGLINNIYYVGSLVDYLWGDKYLVRSSMYLSKNNNMVELKLSMLIL